MGLAEFGRYVPVLSPGQNEAVLRTLAPGELGQCLPDDQRLEMWRLLVGGETRLVAEHLVEEEFLGLRDRAMNLEGMYPRLALGLWQVLADDCRDGIGLGRLGLPERRDDEPVLQGMKVDPVVSPVLLVGERSSPWANAVASARVEATTSPSPAPRP